MIRQVTADITAQNTFSESIQLDKGQTAAVSLSGTFAATVTLQRKLDGSNWRDVDSFTVPTERSFLADAGCEIRIGVKTGNYTSGTASVLIKA